MSGPVNVYAILDDAVEETGPLFEAPNHKVALRNFKMLLEKVPAYQHGDYHLFQVGTYDAGEMKITDCVPFQVDIDA